jgi:hypothetical protein
LTYMFIWDWIRLLLMVNDDWQVVMISVIFVENLWRLRFNSLSKFRRNVLSSDFRPINIMKKLWIRINATTSKGSNICYLTAPHILFWD